MKQLHDDAARLVLREMYLALDELSGEYFGAACGPGCTVCCTDRVLMTTLEAKVLWEAMDDELRRTIDMAAGQVGEARPPLSMNALARYCLAHREPPESSEPEAGAGACPLLADGLCAAYEARPLACRVMFSKKVCPPGGQAVQDSWWVTLGTACFQLVEQAAAGGGFGYLPQTLAAVQKGDMAGLSPCEDLPGIPAPPEHQERLRTILGRVFARPVDGEPLGAWLDRLRRGPG